MLICISASSTEQVKELAQAIWSEITQDALSIGMSFNKNKTKTWHDRVETWGIGSTSPKLRYLSYWIETPSPLRRLDTPTFNHHLQHWTTKANYMFNVICTLSMCSAKGIRTSAILQIIDACCKSMLHYGIEFWGHIPELIHKADSFVYSAMRALFDLPIATPHCAIWSEFAQTPSTMRYNFIIRRIAARHLMHQPLQFMNSYFAPGSLNLKFTSSIDASYQSLPPASQALPVTWPLNVGDIDFSLKLNFDLLSLCDLLVFSDGSYKEYVASFGVVIFSGDSWKKGVSLFEDHGRLTPGNSILDAETFTMITGLRVALSLPHQGRIFLLSDSQSTLKLFLPHPGPEFIHLTPLALDLVKDTKHPIMPTWVKGHNGNIGNTQADLLAHTARTSHGILHPLAGPSYSHLKLSIRTQCTTEWSE